MRSRNLGWMVAAFVCLALGGVRAEEQKTQPERDSGKPAPAKVGEEAKKLLDTKINLQVDKMDLGLALEWAKKFIGDPLPVFASKEAAKKKVSLTFTDAPLAEVLRKITEQTGAVYRYDNGKIEIITPEEKKSLDSGKGTFEAWKAEELKKDSQK